MALAQGNRVFKQNSFQSPRSFCGCLSCLLSKMTWEPFSNTDAQVILGSIKCNYLGTEIALNLPQVILLESYRLSAV